MSSVSKVRLGVELSDDEDCGDTSYLGLFSAFDVIFPVERAAAATRGSTSSLWTSLNLWRCLCG